MEELSVSKKYEFYDSTSFDNVMRDLHRIQKNIESFADKLMHAAEKMESQIKT
ncbi:hypothetical protein ACN9UU_13215 [Staphylococcus caprae]|uniref:hypothetical protein n=1 Tax=Staphylococcus caprae TaxID=29380 RepID=UPI0030C3D504